MAGPFSYGSKIGCLGCHLHAVAVQKFNGNYLIFSPTCSWLIQPENCSPAQQSGLLISSILIHIYAYYSEKASAAEGILDTINKK